MKVVRPSGVMRFFGAVNKFVEKSVTSSVEIFQSGPYRKLYENAANEIKLELCLNPDGVGQLGPATWPPAI